MQSVYKVYSGRAGKCMCGCAGKYSYTAAGAARHDADTSVNERSVKIIAGKVLRNPNAVREGNYAFVEQNGRILVAYFDE
jgi:hypothetical protein